MGVLVSTLDDPLFLPPFRVFFLAAAFWIGNICEDETYVSLYSASPSLRSRISYEPVLEVLGCLEFANFCPVELLDSYSLNLSGYDIFWILGSCWSFTSLAQSTIPISGQLVTSAGAKSSSVKTFLLYGCIPETGKLF